MSQDVFPSADERALTHKLQHRCHLEVPKFNADVGPEAEFAQLEPAIVSSSWMRNSHLEADELTIKLTWRDSGVDVRLLKNARILYWLWDAAEEDFDEGKHLRFTGVCYEAKRSASESGDMAVEMTFHDYTTLFVENKPLATTGMPEWSDTLQTIWERICDNTGWVDPRLEPALFAPVVSGGNMVSSVAALRDRLVFRVSNPVFETQTLGTSVNSRFHVVGKPTPTHGASSWEVWQYCVGALGLISYIDRDQCIVTDTATFFAEDNAPQAFWGENILTIEERANAKVAAKGILLKSFDPLQGLALEAFYPPLGDPRARRTLWSRRANASVGHERLDLGRGGTIHYEEQACFWIQSQSALDAKARSVWEQWSRQAVEGVFSTAETNLFLPSGDKVSLLDLKPGDLIQVAFNNLSLDFLASDAFGGDEDRFRYLVDTIGLSEDVARLILQNSAGMLANLNPVFNVKGIAVDLGPESYRCEVRYWNRVYS